MASKGALRSELLNDPLAIGYAGMSDLAAFSSLTDETARPAPDMDTLSGAAIYNVIDRAEYLALTAAEKDELRVILALGDNIDISVSSKARAALAAMFDAVSVTRTALLAMVTGRTQSRAQELGLGVIDVDLVAAARVPAQP